MAARRTGRGPRNQPRVRPGTLATAWRGAGSHPRRLRRHAEDPPGTEDARHLTHPPGRRVVTAEVLDAAQRVDDVEGVGLEGQIERVRGHGTKRGLAVREGRVP